MHEFEEISHKNLEFRAQIRRKQIDQQFYERRLKFAETLIREEQDDIMKDLDTPEKKKQWVYRKSAELGQTPRSNWYQIFRTLSISTRSFSEGDFEDWLESGIIRCLVQTLKQDYLSLQLSKLSACILQDIFFYLSSQSPLMSQILQLQFLLDLIQLCSNPQNPAQYYYQLMIVMIQNCAYIRDLLIDNGLVQILSARLKGYFNLPALVDSDQLYCALSLAYRLVRIYQIKGGRAFPKGNVISVFIPIFDVWLPVVKREDCLKVLLKSFASLAMTQKEYIITHLFESPNLINYLLFVLQNQSSPQNRAIASSILASILASQKNFYSQQLLRRNILDKLLSCFQMQDNTRQCIDSMLRLISNIVVSSLEDSRKVTFHPIFGEVMSHANQTQNQKTHETGIYIISSLIQMQNFQITESLLKKYNILQTLIQGLRNSIISIPNAQQILRSLILLIRMYNRIYTGSENKVTMDLQHMYNINSVLTEVQEKIKNQKILSLVQILLQAFNNGEL